MDKFSWSLFDGRLSSRVCCSASLLLGLSSISHGLPRSSISHFRNGMRCMAFGQIQLVSLRRPLKFTSLCCSASLLPGLSSTWPDEKLYFCISEMGCGAWRLDKSSRSLFDGRLSSRVCCSASLLGPSEVVTTAWGLETRSIRVRGGPKHDQKLLSEGAPPRP